MKDGEIIFQQNFKKTAIHEKLDSKNISAIIMVEICT